ncbi:MAG: ATP-dependent 6-phosphofructokinase [Candidatus Omnitrophota bacterium]|nr:ATP-dependent 6-phosphofructokinase [Candidatus Omnitrophota bacterium]
MTAAADLLIPRLGPPKVASPLRKFFPGGADASHFVAEDAGIVFDVSAADADACAERGCSIPALEKAGPRSQIFFDPEETSAAIVTCGGLCPGINDVIRSLVMTLTYRYGVRRILGIRYGYQGFIREFGHEPVTLKPDDVADIHRAGGSILGTSRGRQDSGLIVDFLNSNKINLLFVIGGDGTQRGALEIAETAEKRKLNISVIGIPKTVDNDILYLDKSFGFDTAVAEAVKAISTAHTEARAQVGGIGLVKFMGRHSGFIASYAALAMNDANFVLIPEIPFELEGPKGLLAALETRLRSRGHAVILVAEGAGQDLIRQEVQGKDASGNILFNDIGLFLRECITAHFSGIGMEINLKYIDPSYLLRALPASAPDSVYCFRLGQHAAHAAMSGRTKMVVGMRHRQYVHIPMSLIAKGRKQVDPHSDIWVSVLEATGQPAEMRSHATKDSKR